MKIFDCFMYLDEEVVLDVRLNALNKYVDQFIIVESKYLLNGEKRELNFDIHKYKKSKDKIIYLIQEKQPEGIIKLNQNDDEGTKSYKLIFNAHLRENAQRNHIAKGLDEASDNDIILIPTRSKTISVTGEVITPAFYELNTNNSVNSILKYAGGLTKHASNQVIISSLDRTNIYVPKDLWGKTFLMNGDSLIIPRKFNSQKTISGGNQKRITRNKQTI